MCESGRLLLKSGRLQKLQCTRNFPPLGGIFQTDRKLYIAGGRWYSAGHEEYFGALLSMSYSGQLTELEPMKHPRSMLSLCGLPSLLLAIGGTSKTGLLRNCDSYSTRSRHWRDLPWLSESDRFEPGGCLLESRRAFCFCGKKFEGDKNPIESL